MVEGQVAQVLKPDKLLSEAEQQIDLFKVKIVQGVIIELGEQFVLELLIEEDLKTDLELLIGQLVVQTGLTIVQEFHLA